jgi:hypothetical protein
MARFEQLATVALVVDGDGRVLVAKYASGGGRLVS